VIQETPAVAFVRVKNIGNIASPSFVTEFNPNSLGISGSGTTAVTEETAPLEPGEERTIEFLFTYAKPGNYRAVAEVNPRRTVKESNYANNTKFVEVQAEPLPINLDFSTGIEVSSANFIADGGNLFPGEEATVSFTVENFGPIATGPFEVQFQSQTGGFKTTRFIEGLNPGESKLETFNVTYTKPGAYTMTAILDPTEAVDKTATGFKPIEETRTVTVEPIDLNFSSAIEVSSPEFNVEGVLYPNEAAEATVDVFNNSPVKTPAFAVQFQSQTGGFKTTEFLSGLNAFESKAVPFKVKYFKPGSYTMTAILDPFKAVDKKVNGLNPIEESRTVTVNEKTATVLVEAPTLETTVSYPKGNWFINLLSYEPGAKCFDERINIKDELITKLVHNEAPVPGTESCPSAGGFGFNKVGTFNTSSLFTEVHLKETQPLDASVSVVAYPESFNPKKEVPTGSNAGKASVTKTRTEYVELPSKPFSNVRVGGQGCVQPNGSESPQECFASFFSLFLTGHAGPAFAARIAPRQAAVHLARSAAVRALVAGTPEVEPEGSLTEKQAIADREASEHEAAEREAAERAVATAEAAERAKAVVAEQEAIKAVQELGAQIVREEAEAG
jgi:hypothetical protein